MTTEKFKIPSEQLLLVAGAVWCIAGMNIANLGISAYMNESGWLFWTLIVGTLVIFTVFHMFVFTKMVGKHSDRIRGSQEDRMHIWKFFDKRSYIIMACMMGGGIGLRMSGFVPDWFIAFFYTGLGAALIVAGVSFILRFFKSTDPSCPVLPKK